MTTLNLITDQGAQQLHDYYQNVLNEKDAQAVDIYQAHFTLGLLAWRNGNIDDAKTFLQLAAVDTVNIVESRDTKNTTAERIPHSVAIPFLVVINFGDKNTVERLANLSRTQWFQPETKSYKPLADLLDILRRHSVGDTLDVKQLKKVIEQNKSDEVDIFYKPWVNNLTQGLLAVAQKDEVSANQFLQRLLELHEEMALESAWKNLVEGLLSFWALTLINVAKKSGLSLNVSSRYI